MKVHSTAIVHKGAKLADYVEVGPYTIIESNVSIGKGTKIGASCFIGSFTKIGKDNKIFKGAIVGSISQDLKFKGHRAFLEIGDENIIREYVTINRSSNKDGRTKIGNNNIFMAYSHVAHDCIIGNGAIIANCGTLGGYVTIGDKAIIGGIVGVHQFVRIGKLAIIGGCSKVVQDIPPYCVADGHPAKVIGANVVGLKRAGLKTNKINAVRNIIKILFHSGLSTSSALDKIKRELSSFKEATDFINFIKESKRGLSKQHDD